MLLRQLYTNGSLEKTEDGARFIIKNRLTDSSVVRVDSVQIGMQVVYPEDITVRLPNGSLRIASEISEAEPVAFALKQMLEVHCKLDSPISHGKYEIVIRFKATNFGKLTVKVSDSYDAQRTEAVRIPRDAANDYSKAAILSRQKFVEDFTGQKIEHIGVYSLDPEKLPGNIENFTGVAQIPIGFAGPLLVNGEHAMGQFLIPMATTEGTLVASYNRGMMLLNACGGVKCTVIGDAMQRAPVFVFEDARGARDFVNWVKINEREIALQAESTSSIAKLQYIDTILSNKFAYLRFNYSTGDAAGQNMVGRATYVACTWIIDQYKDHPITNFYLESNLATDKKASQINIMRTRGKRVVAEALIKRDILIEKMRVEPEKLNYHTQVSNVGAFLSGANNNGAHSANGITAMFIATGQDVANVSESSAAIFYSELTPQGDLYVSITLPSLIVATHGGGTSLPTQNECLNFLGCKGRGTVNKFAEIVAGVVLAGELSLGSAISSSDWVSSHEQYGRNR
jgi:hydroxymethylglutaryl-CoA reductase (NADPH)